MIRATSHVHQKRLSRNLGVGLALLGLVAIVFGLSVVKITRGDAMQGFDHVARPEMEQAGGQ